jgi:hypothetical protein
VIYGLGGVVSGHTLKHLAAAVSVGWIVRMVLRRETVQEERPDPGVGPGRACDSRQPVS